MLDTKTALSIIKKNLPFKRSELCEEAWQTLNTIVLGTTHNNGSTPCQFFSRDKVCTGKAADGGNMYQSVPWCNHEPSQRAVP